MKKIYIWGAVDFLDSLLKTINKELCVVVGIVDNDENKQGNIVENDIIISSPKRLINEEFDFVLIAPKNYQTIINECEKMGIKHDKILNYWDDGSRSPYIDCKLKKILELEEQLEKYKWRLENLPYELNVKPSPPIRSSEELLNLIIENNFSLCRFGDGELEIMRGQERPWFQNVDEKLSLRLQEIFSSYDPNIIIALANNFGSLEQFTEKAADAIRKYLYGGTREEIMKFIDYGRKYYDAYVSRPYILYRDKSHAKKIFSLLKKVWYNRDILIVEGNYSKMGVGNDLFENAKGIRRILCPEKNSFCKYEEILDAVKKIATDSELILISLGPAATVLAYDLAKLGFQAIDIGQVDNEYEWYLMNAKERVKIPGKRVAELGWCRQPKDMIDDSVYRKQIIGVIR